MSALRSLIASFDINTGAAQEHLKNLNEKIDGGVEKLERLGEAFLDSAIVEGFREMIMGSIEAGARLQDMADRLGVSADSLDRMGFFAQQSGASIEDAAQALMFLNKNLAAASQGSDAQAGAFARLGISIRDSNGNIRSATDMLPDLANAFQNLHSPALKTQAAMDLFGRSGTAMIPMLNEGSEGIERLSKTFDEFGGGATAKLAPGAKEASDGLNQLSFGWKNLKASLAHEAMPYLNMAIDWGKKFLAYVIKLSKSTHLMKDLMMVLGVASAAAGLKAYAAFAKVLGILKPGKTSVLSLLSSFGELGLIVGLVVLLGLAFDDLRAFMDGDESLIGNVMNELLGADVATESANKLRDAWETCKTTFEDIKPPLKEVLKDLEEAGKDSAPEVTKAFTELLNITAGIVKNLAEIESFLLKTKSLGKLTEAMTGNFGGVAGNVGQKLGLKLGGAVNERTDNKDRVLAAGSLAFGTGNVASIGPPMAPPIHAPVTNNVEVTVNGGPSNADTAKAVASGIARALGAPVTQADINSAYAGGKRNIP